MSKIVERHLKGIDHSLGLIAKELERIRKQGEGKRVKHTVKTDGLGAMSAKELAEKFSADITRVMESTPRQ